MKSLFVYGTLMNGEPNHRIISGSEFVSEAITAWPGWELTNYGGFPALYHFINEEAFPNRVKGEVYLVSDEVLSRTDRLEGHPNWYRRRAAVPFLHLIDQRVALSEVYIMQGEIVGKTIPSIDGTKYWKDR